MISHHKNALLVISLILIGLGLTFFFNPTKIVNTQSPDNVTPPVTNTEPPKPITGTCYIGGCSGQICSDVEGMMSNCEFRPEYQCYKSANAKCERQATGKCGWTQSEKLNMCLDSAGFEGEANPEVMKLDMKTWNWLQALYNDGTEIKPKGTKAFTLSFLKNNKFSATTDCNSIGGNYSVNGKTIIFSDIFSTEMYCEGSQESEFSKLIQNTTSYHFTNKGELILDLKFDSGTVTFR